MSEGYHPKPKINFPSALALGIEGLDEVVELESAEPAESPRRAAAAGVGRTRGLDGYFGADHRERRAQAPGARHALSIPRPRRAQPHVRKGAEDLLAQATLPVRREGRSQPVDLRAGI